MVSRSPPYQPPISNDGMRKRLTRITTRTGDAGESGLADGTRHPKTNVVFRALGDIDELNSVLGVAIAQLVDADLQSLLNTIQSRLFDLGGVVATPAAHFEFDDEVRQLESSIARFNASLEPLVNFILPGGHPAAASIHHARSVCRRAERSLWTHLEHSQLDDASGAVYLNRLSDLLFILARTINAGSGRAEALWQPRQKPSE